MSLTDDDRKWITGIIQASDERTAAAFEKVETALLTDFRKWASPYGHAYEIPFLRDPSPLSGNGSLKRTSN